MDKSAKIPATKLSDQRHLDVMGVLGAMVADAGSSHPSVVVFFHDGLVDQNIIRQITELPVVAELLLPRDTQLPDNIRNLKKVRVLHKEIFSGNGLYKEIRKMLVVGNKSDVKLRDMVDLLRAGIRSLSFVGAETGGGVLSGNIYLLLAQRVMAACYYRSISAVQAWVASGRLDLFKLFWLLCTGQMRPAFNLLLPYYRHYVPLRIKMMLPERLRQRVMDNLLVSKPVTDSISSAIYYNALINQDKIQSLTILYVINHVDKSTQRYRVFNYAAELAKKGFSSRIVTEDKLVVRDLADVDIVVFNRICWSPRLEEHFEILKQKRIPTIFDVDDLIFNPEQHTLLRGIESREPEARAAFLDGMHRWRKTLLECDYATVSTFPLRREVEKLGKPAYVLPNTLSKELMVQAGKAKAEIPHNKEYVEIGYFSGTRTHEIDFAVCKSALFKVLAEHPSARLHIIGELENTIEFTRFGSQFIRHPLLHYDVMLDLLSTMDIAIAPLELNNLFTDCKSELKAFEPALFSIPCIASPTASFASVIEHGVNGMLAASSEDWQKSLADLIVNKALRAQLGQEAHRTFMRRHSAEIAVREAVSVYIAAARGIVPRNTVSRSYSKLHSKQPVISVIAILYNKAKEVRYFLESLRRQDIQEKYEIILIDDASPDRSVETVEDYLYWKQYYSDDKMDVVILKNHDNLGNCASRNLGIAHARSEILLIVDADCVFNPGFLSSHVAAHQTGYCDVAVGPRGIETGEEDPFSCLGRLELDLPQVQKESRLQDPINLDSFVNCVTRNFSIKRPLINGLLFDEAFTYNASPQSGFGWEDVELGCRLYEAGARIWYLADTISLHVTHPSGNSEKTKPLRSLRNFRRLHEKHPVLMLEARQWTLRTYKAILNWARTTGAELDNNIDFEFLEQKFSPIAGAPIISMPTRPLRVLTHRWHISHQYELYRLGHQFDLVTGAGTRMCDAWDWEVRKMPANTRMVPYEKIDPRNYDLMILHFDENILHPERCNNKVPADWGKTFLSLLGFRNQIPAIAVCHGTPQFFGQYDINYSGSDLEAVDEISRNEIVNLLGDITVVCNSHQAQDEWGFANSRVIWHGFSPHDFPAGRHDRLLGGMLERAMLNRPHYNGYFIYKAVKEKLGDQVDFSHLAVPPPPENISKGNVWATIKFQNYVRELGRFAIYFNPTKRSPMPRLRGEAMLTGAVSISLQNHDVDRFISNGVNGYYSAEPEQLADYILYLAKNPHIREKTGIASRLLAMDIFNHDRYLAEWTSLIKQIMG